ncbi:Uncharacterised protein [Chlamydia abortus]|nr:Uncharacterised protein [Chlamydia abortus]
MPLREEEWDFFRLTSKAGIRWADQFFEGTF